MSFTPVFAVRGTMLNIQELQRSMLSERILGPDLRALFQAVIKEMSTAGSLLCPGNTHWGGKGGRSFWETSPSLGGSSVGGSEPASQSF